MVAPSEDTLPRAGDCGDDVVAVCAPCGAPIDQADVTPATFSTATGPTCGKCAADAGAAS